MILSADTLIHEIPNREFADSLFRAVNRVSQHTDNFIGLSGMVTWASFFASIITILGLVMIGLEIFHRRTTRKCQKKIILDLIRHFFTNNAISEVIRMKLPQGKAVLMEGIMERYCVLDSDIDLGQLSYSAKSYEQLHSLRVKLRNYNIAARVAEKHFVNADCPRSRRLADLNDILVRSIKLTEGFIDFAKKRHMKIDEGVIKNYIIGYYASKGNEVVPDCPMQIPEREPGTHRAFYDDAPYGLKAIENRIIHERYAYVSFLSDSAASSPATKKERSY